jgi:predicted membrane-bound spermidine synthase
VNSFATTDQPVAPKPKHWKFPYGLAALPVLATVTASLVILGVARAAWEFVFAVIGAVLLVALYAGMFGFAAYLDRRVFPHGLDLNFKSGWLVIGVILGACVGCMFSGSCSDAGTQRLESAIHTMEGALVGVGIGMIVDLAENLPRTPIRFQFRLWHIPAFVYIFAVCFFVLLEFIDLLRLRSMRLN